MAYAIIKNAQRGRALGIDVVALVDRGKTRGKWWTSDDPALIMRYCSEDAARRRADGLSGSRVVEFTDAIRRLLRQAHLITENQSDLDDFDLLDDPSWDSHKS